MDGSRPVHSPLIFTCPRRIRTHSQARPDGPAGSMSPAPLFLPGRRSKYFRADYQSQPERICLMYVYNMVLMGPHFIMTIFDIAVALCRWSLVYVKGHCGNVIRACVIKISESNLINFEFI